MPCAWVYAVTVLLVAACGGNSPEAESPPAAPSPETAAEAEPVAPSEPAPEEPAPPPKSARDILTSSSGVPFAFSLDDSDAKAKHQEDCDKKARGDQVKALDCMAKASEIAAKESIRFETDDKGMWWLSLGEEKGKEVVYNKVMFTIAGEEGAAVTLKPEGKDLGKRPMKKLPPEIVIEIPDEHTIVMTDPVKGKLVFKAK